MKTQVVQTETAAEMGARIAAFVNPRGTATKRAGPAFDPARACMKTAEKLDVGSAHASLEQARAYVTETLRTLEELRQRRAQISTDIDVLAKRPALWGEVVTEIVGAAISDCAAQYRPALTHHIRERNPNLARRRSYEHDLPFLRFGGFGDDQLSAPALCYFMGDLIRPRLTDLLLGFDAPFPEVECIAAKDRATQRADLDEQLRTVDAEIGQLQGALDQLKGF